MSGPYAKVYLRLLKGEHDPVRRLGIVELCLEEDRLGHPRPTPMPFATLCLFVGWPRTSVRRFILKHRDCYPRLADGLDSKRTPTGRSVDSATKVEPAQSSDTGHLPDSRWTPTGQSVPDNTATTVGIGPPQPTSLPAYTEDPVPQPKKAEAISKSQWDLTLNLLGDTKGIKNGGMVLLRRYAEEITADLERHGWDGKTSAVMDSLKDSLPDHTGRGHNARWTWACIRAWCTLNGVTP